MSQSVFEYEIFVRTTAEQLWQALTEPDWTRQYWCDTRIESTWQVGAPWKSLIPDGRTGDAGEIVELERPARLVMTWENQFVPELRAEGPSRLTYVLEQQGEAVKFTLTHEMDRPDSKLIAAVRQGWPEILCSLKSLLETGQPLESTRHWPEGY